jgi:UDP-N-acetylmuramyl pentapeptide synthase
LAGLDGRAWLVLGDMAELGEQSPELHTGIGRQAKVAGIERLFTLGDEARAATTAFGAGSQALEGREALVAVLSEALDESGGEDLTILVKGSRCMRMEEIVQALADKTANDEGLT